jgi:hypothetical protein
MDSRPTARISLKRNRLKLLPCWCLACGAYPKIISEAPKKSSVEAFARIFSAPFRNFGICTKNALRRGLGAFQEAPWGASFGEAPFSLFIKSRFCIEYEYEWDLACYAVFAILSAYPKIPKKAQ